MPLIHKALYLSILLDEDAQIKDGKNYRTTRCFEIKEANEVSATWGKVTCPDCKKTKGKRIK